MMVMAVVAVTMLSLAASAGTISGKISGVSGESVVYVEAPAGKPSRPHPGARDRPEGLDVSAAYYSCAGRHNRAIPEQRQCGHNVFWSSVGGNKKLTHNLGTWPKGDKRPFKFDNPGAVPLLCNVHPEMAGYVVVSPTPYFAVTDKSGAYKIENVRTAATP